MKWEEVEKGKENAQDEIQRWRTQSPKQEETTGREERERVLEEGKEEIV